MVILVSPSFFFPLSAFTAAVLIVAHILNYFESCVLDTVVLSFTHDSFTLWIGGERRTQRQGHFKDFSNMLNQMFNSHS
jgi:hypothetical protein